MSLCFMGPLQRIHNADRHREDGDVNFRSLGHLEFRRTRKEGSHMHQANLCLFRTFPQGAYQSVPRQTSPTRKTTRQPSPLRATRVAPREEPPSFSREVSAINRGAEGASAEPDPARKISGSDSGGARSVSAGTNNSGGTGDFSESVTTLGSLESSRTADTPAVTENSAGNVRSVSGTERNEGGSRGTSTYVYGAESISRFGKSSVGSPERTSTLLDVTGRPRKTPVSPPKSILRLEVV